MENLAIPGRWPVSASLLAGLGQRALARLAPMLGAACGDALGTTLEFREEPPRPRRRLGAGLPTAGPMGGGLSPEGAGRGGGLSATYLFDLEEGVQRTIRVRYENVDALDVNISLANIDWEEVIAGAHNGYAME